MLNRVRVMAQIEQHAQSLFVDVSDQSCRVAELWKEMCNDRYFKQLVDCTATLRIPQWNNELALFIPIGEKNNNYSVGGIDGSQIYPDRHQGTLCFLINIGTTIAHYSDPTSQFSCHSTPYVFMPSMGDCQPSADWVNARRQELEFEAALSIDADLICLDGSLIFWHLEHAPLALQTEFIKKYAVLLQQYKIQQRITAGYISAPRTRDLIQLVAFFARHKNKNIADALFNQLVDSNVMQLLLPPSSRTTIFVSNSSWQDAYEHDVRPCFFYLNNGYEIVRIELPWWIAQDQQIVTMIAEIMVDQSHKGNGYPVILAEAHEQAVVKGADRDFFYVCIAKIGIDLQNNMIPSYKNLKKKTAGI